MHPILSIMATPGKFPQLNTASLLLRQFNSEDLENIFRGLSDPDVIKYYGISYSSLEESKDQLKYFRDLEENGTGIWWAICDSRTHSFYGAVGFNDLVNKKAEIGFWLLPEHWGKGIITNVIPLVLDHGYITLDLHRIEAIVESENSNCKKLMSKLCFTLEATIKDREIKNGTPITLHMYTKFKEGN